MSIEVRRASATCSIILAVSAATLFLSAEAHGMELAANGKTSYIIVVADDSTDVESNAANELRDYLGKVTGADFGISRESEASEKPHRILVGHCRELKTLAPKLDLTTLGTEGIAIKTIGDTLILAGGRPRGTLYAVYTFLEDVVGCRWWTSSEGFIPKKTRLRIRPLNITYTPTFLYRETYYRETVTRPEFAAKLKLNGHYENIPSDYGGHLSIIGFVHTFYRFLPPETYFAEHPEWYSEINGKRTADRAQLCVTNEEMRKEMTRVALELIRKTPDAGFISISQNDAFGKCECAKCKGLEEAEGSPAGPLLHFVNAIAADIEKEFPSFLIETLAYQYTRKPPLHVKPRHNVVVRLCSIECSFVRSLTDPVNKAFQDDIAGWRAITPNLYVWDYLANFMNFLVPHPNLRVLGPNLKLFAAKNVIGMFEQGDAYSTIGDFIRMRAWVIAHLLWDPSRDANALMKEFLRGYYGPAAPYIAKYLDVVCDAGENANRFFGCFDSDPCFMKLRDMNEATRLLRKAQNAVRGDAVLAERVRRDRMPLDLLWIQRGSYLRTLAENSGKPYMGPEDMVAAGEDYISLAHKYNIGNYTESMPFTSYEPTIRQCAKSQGLTTGRCKLISDPNRLEIQDEMFILDNVPTWAEMVDDPLASDGKAARMPGTHFEWATKFMVTQDLADSMPGKWHCYLIVRCETDSPTSLAFTYGIYDLRNSRSVADKSAQIESCSDAAYHVFDLGAHELSGGSYFWAAPPGKDKGVKAVYVDCIVLIPEK